MTRVVSATAITTGVTDHMSDRCMHRISAMDTAINRQPSPCSMVTIKSVEHRTAAQVNVSVPAKVEVEEDSRRVDNSVSPSIRPIDYDIAWPRGVNHEVVEYLHRAVIVKVDSNNLIRAITLNSQLWMPVTLVVSVFEQSA